MNPLLNSFIAAILRHLLGFVGAWFVQRGILNPAQADEMILGLIVSLVALLWSLWNKYKSKLEFFTAAGSHSKVSLDEVRASIRYGTHAAATTPSDQKPTVTSTFK